MKTLFQIQSESVPTSEATLLLEIGNGYCCLAHYTKDNHTMQKLSFSNYDEKDEEQGLEKLLSAETDNTFSSVVVCAGYPEAMLVPTKYFDGSPALHQAMYGNNGVGYHHDRIPEWQMVNLFSVPGSVERLVAQKFNSVSYLHAYTPMIKVYNGYMADNNLVVHFTPQQMRVFLKKNNSIHLVQTYAYQTSLDAVYFLLKICTEFQLAASEIHLVLSGLIEKESALFVELRNYFLNLHFASTPGITVPPNEYPPYFFTSLFNLATCVSSVEV